MRKYNFKYSIGIAIISLVCVNVSALSAQEVNPEESLSQNQGNFVSKNIPEQKKYKRTPGGAKQVIHSRSTTKDVSEGSEENKPYSPVQPVEKNLTELQKQARAYRQEGVKFQDAGNLANALEYYQKAIQMDSTYAVAYNDLGVAYELMGNTGGAEQYYIEAIRINPGLLSPYSNLALLYENKGDTDKASLLWKKRIELGSPEDPWTKIAKDHYKAICLATQPQEINKAEVKAEPEKAQTTDESNVEVKAGAKVTTPKVNAEAPTEAKSVVSEKEILNLFKEARKERAKVKQENKAIAEKYLQQANQSREREDYAKARDLLLDAGQLDPGNKEIEDLTDKVQTRALSR